MAWIRCTRNFFFEATSVKVGRLDERIMKLEGEIEKLSKEKEDLLKSGARIFFTQG